MKLYYEDSELGIQIYHGDCRDFLASNSQKFDAIITDPPYGVELGKKPRNQKSLQVMPYKSHDDSVEALDRLIAEVYPATRVAGGRVVLTPGVKNMWRWPKPDHVGSFFYPCATGCNSWGFSCWQPIFYYGKDPYGGKVSRPDSFSSVEYADEESRAHPCPKPVKQLLQLMERCTLTGESILDPFMGSGTTLVAAKRLKCRCVGVEIEERYCEIAKNRLAQGVLFGVGV